MYEVVDEITDPETEMIVNMARKKYEVRKMLDGTVSYYRQYNDMVIVIENGENRRHRRTKTQ